MQLSPVGTMIFQQILLTNSLKGMYEYQSGELLCEFWN